MPSIEFKGVTKKFGSVVAVDNLDLTIPDGGFVTLLGPSGCGKTTTLRMIAGLEMPTEGEIHLDNRVLSSSITGEAIPPEKRGMGLVFQSYALWPHMTVGQNIKFGLEMQKKSRAEQEERLNELTTLLHIQGLEERYPLQLSGGQQQRVALARMLAISPQVLLLDEPLSNLDARLRMEMRAELKRLHEKLGNTIVYVTHDQMEAMTMASHVAVMLDGTLQQYAPPMEIYRRPNTLFVGEFVGSPSINLFAVNNQNSRHLFQSILEYLSKISQNVDELPLAHTIGVRPESIRMVKDGSKIPDSCWHHKAVIDTILPTGPEWIVSVKIDDCLIFLTTDSEPVVGKHEQVDLVVAEKDFHIYNENRTRVADNRVMDRASISA
jgi:iron(III) transport system ATP-binding protein